MRFESGDRDRAIGCGDGDGPNRGSNIFKQERDVVERGRKVPEAPSSVVGVCFLENVLFRGECYTAAGSIPSRRVAGVRGWRQHLVLIWVCLVPRKQRLAAIIGLAKQVIVTGWENQIDWNSMSNMVKGNPTIGGLPKP